ncbi:adenosine receptor A1-like [Astyanax mexicanus]|uniref:adenosine receptor A1-like n=1 Tax=Astyanax mexicanus TaxID=7994 RepID=UPI0020CB24E2|nr:adenosine receptor A1-like [Astyanax mexicanus]
MSENAMWIFLPLEVVVAVVCCLGNALVIWAVRAGGSLRKPTFCFITALAVADFLVGSVAIPLGVLVDVGMKISFYGCLFMCCNVLMIEMASVTLLLAIAVDRFLRVHIPLTYKTTVIVKRSWIVVTLCWFMAALISFVPMFGWNNSDNLDNLDSTVHSNSTSFKCGFFAVVSTSYLVKLCFLSCFLPVLAIVTGLYCYIFLTTRRQLRAQIGVRKESGTNYLKEQRLAASLALVYVLFAVGWIPVLLMQTVKHYYGVETVPSSVMHVGVLLSHANSAVNPVVYSFRIPMINKAFRKLWVRLFHCRAQQDNDPNNVQTNTDNSTKNSTT